MSPESFTVLIVASDADLRHFIRKSLETTGFMLEEARSAKEAVDLVVQKAFDVVLIEQNVRDEGASEACRSLKVQAPGIGIIVVRTAGNDEDEASLLQAGADDCIVTPFRFREIVARIRVILQRPASSGAPQMKMHARNLEIDLEARTVFRRGEPIHLSPREFDLLSALMKNAGTAITHGRLLQLAWGSTSPSRACLRTYVKALRHKLEDDAAHPRYILTEAWVGYRFNNPQV